MAKQYQLVFNCTPAQLETALNTTLPLTGWVITRAPNQYTGLMIGTAIGTGTAAGLGQIDWTYDGMYFLKFFGANVVPVPIQTNVGIPSHNLVPAQITQINATLLATLGVPVISPNLAIPPSNVVD